MMKSPISPRLLFYRALVFIMLGLVTNWAPGLTAKVTIESQSTTEAWPQNLSPNERQHPIVRLIDRLRANENERQRVLSALRRGTLRRLGPEFEYFLYRPEFQWMLEDVLDERASSRSRTLPKVERRSFGRYENEPFQLVAAQPEGPPHGMAFYGDLMFVGSGTVIIALDTSTDPATKVVRQRVPFAIRDLAIEGDSLYVLGERILQVYDLKSLGKRAREGQFLALIDAEPLDFDALNLFVQGLFTFITSTQGVHISNFTSVEGIVKLSLAAAPFAFLAVTYPKANQLLVGTWTGMKIFDISNPSAPQELGSYTTNETLRSFTAAGQHAFLGKSAEIEVLNTSNPAQIKKDTTIAGEGQDIKAFDCNGSSTLLVLQRIMIAGYNSSNWPIPFFSTVLGRVWDKMVLSSNPCGQPTRIGGYGQDGIEWRNYDGQNMTMLGEYNTPGPIFATVPLPPIRLDGMGMALGLSLWSLYHMTWTTNPEQPFMISSTLNGLGSEWGFYGGLTAWKDSSGKTYVAAGLNSEKGATIQDITDPPNPAEKARLQVNGWVESIDECGNYLFISNDKGELFIFDKSNPNNPVKVSSLKIPKGYISKIKLDCPNRLYAAAGEGGFLILDISDKANPKILSQVQGDVSKFSVDGNFACIYDLAANGLRLLDIQDPAKPQQTDFLSKDDIKNMRDFGVGDVYLHVMNFEGFNQTYRILNGKLKRLWGYGDPYGNGGYGSGGDFEIYKPTGTGGLNKQADTGAYLIYVAAGDAGMYVLRFDPAAINSAPVFAAALPDTTVQQGETLVYDFDASDADGDSLQFVPLSLPTGATLNPASGLFQWPVTTQVTPGDYMVSVGATDGRDTTTASATVTVVSTTGVENSELPKSFALHAVYPNPFVDRLSVRYSAPAAGVVRVILYDILGRRVKALAPASVPAGSSQEIRIKAGALPAGLYLVQVEANFAGRVTRVSRKMLHLP